MKFSQRYGYLEPLAAKTDGHCHLCHEPAPLESYGTIAEHGDDAVTVDHLHPQSEGGDDDDENLLIAHGICNSIRGTRDIEEVRMELAGTTDAPMSTATKTIVSAGAGTLLGVAVGFATGKRRPDGTIEFNAPAALLTGIFAGLLLREGI